ncbi:MAG: hypothetical protein ACREFK_09575 [Stellaceae bacterium]
MKRSGRDADRLVEVAEMRRQRSEAIEKRLGRDEAGANENIQRTRLIAGEIDHAELTRKIIARFPKILAKLAE